MPWLPPRSLQHTETLLQGCALCPHLRSVRLQLMVLKIRDRSRCQSRLAQQCSVTVRRIIYACSGSDRIAAGLLSLTRQLADLGRQKRWKQCFVDEHYMPTVLARAGLDNETDCHGGLLSTDFTVKNSTHPVEYQPDAINSALCAVPAQPARPIHNSASDARFIFPSP